VAAIRGLRGVQASVVRLQESFQRKEKELAHVVKVGRTEMQDAVLTTLGRAMGSFAEAFNRDRWRVYKCEERLRVVNLGGGAIGTGLGAPRQYIFRAADRLREITGLGLARAENLVEATQNQDAFAEVSGILKALAVNLIKVCGDLRLLSSGPDAGLGEISLPPRQAGSSAMPGKVNPVIPEAVAQAAMAAIGHDAAITQACAAGSLELNPFLPLVADSLLHMLDTLDRAADLLARLCVDGIGANEAECRRQVENATAAVTALAGRIGYERAGEIAREGRRTGRGVKDVARERAGVTPEEFDRLVSPEAVLRLGEPPAGTTGVPGAGAGPEDRPAGGAMDRVPLRTL
jgi:aspartate ammonia-lyase